MKRHSGGRFKGLLEHGYGTIYLDPPWRFTAYNKADAGNRAPPYPTMAMEEIAALPIVELAARNCWLYCWTSGPYMQHTMDIMRGWGFRYSTQAFTWVKMKRSGEGFHKGLGMTTRKNTEIVLLGKLGSPPVVSRPDELLVTDADGDQVHETATNYSPLREHSRKPDDIRTRIEAMARGPRIELFARQCLPGWEAWGNETGKWAPLEEHHNG